MLLNSESEENRSAITEHITGDPDSNVAFMILSLVASVRFCVYCMEFIHFRYPIVFHNYISFGVLCVPHFSCNGYAFLGECHVCFFHIWCTDLSTIWFVSKPASAN